MPENESEPVFELDLGEHGKRLVFTSPDGLKLWIDGEAKQWQWLNEAGSPATDGIWNNLNSFQSRIYNYANEWHQAGSRIPEIKRLFANLQSIFEEYYKSGRLLNSSSPAAEFV